MTVWQAGLHPRWGCMSPHPAGKCAATPRIPPAVFAPPAPPNARRVAGGEEAREGYGFVPTPGFANQIARRSVAKAGYRVHRDAHSTADYPSCKVALIARAHRDPRRRDYHCAVAQVHGPAPAPARKRLVRLGRATLHAHRPVGIRVGRDHRDRMNQLQEAEAYADDQKTCRDSPYRMHRAVARKAMAPAAVARTMKLARCRANQSRAWRNRAFPVAQVAQIHCHVMDSGLAKNAPIPPLPRTRLRPGSAFNPLQHPLVQR